VKQNRDRLESGAIERALGTSRFGRPLHVYDRAGSTNDLARELADQGAPEGSTVIALVQTGGRGRRGRSWQSPAGGLWLSVVLRPVLEAERWPLVGFAASVGAAAAVGDVTGALVRLKWPNDLIASGRKLGGVLVESSGNAAVVGIGINANLSMTDLPAEVRASAVTLMSLLGRPVDLETLAAAVLTQFERHHDLLQRDPGALLALWRARDLTVGRAVRISGVYDLEGTAEEVDGSGALLVRTAAGVQRVAAGEVSLRTVDASQS